MHDHYFPNGFADPPKRVPLLAVFKVLPNEKGIDCVTAGVGAAVAVGGGGAGDPEPRGN